MTTSAACRERGNKVEDRENMKVIRENIHDAGLLKQTRREESRRDRRERNRKEIPCLNRQSLPIKYNGMKCKYVSEKYN